ncbi:MAG: alpha/beta fold hydrolase, partial [Candidatus Eisenbacteria bacterium]|nr:alpha/beta fold hydrolase [Candidatus Eisenbacteria bacterium]
MSRIRVSGGLLLRVRESGDPGSGANAPPGPVAGEADAATRREEEPGPPPALLLHGFAATGAFWEPIARDLDRRCLMPDLPGHGASDAPVPAG